MSSSIEAALNPDLKNTRSRERPLSNREQMQRAKAKCSATGDPTADFKGTKLTCTGDIFVGIFFDGTGNNEEADFLKPPRPVRKQKHSNVVRLYHAFQDKERIGTTGYYRYYIPGVGTLFNEIGDDGKGIGGYISQKLGSAGAWNGEPRIIWGLTRVFNAVSQYVYKSNIIDNAAAAALAEDLSGVTSIGLKRRLMLKHLWQSKLKSELAGRKPEVTQLNISVYGFSRGAAEARAFVNWLYELCEEKDGGWLFAGIPLRVQFLGIFDTVASVGAAGLYSMLEGRQSWAWNNMQVHPAVEQCLHLVAGHEVRACFPLDSVRIDGKYPANVKEYVYPGSHSDVGGGYIPLCLGKNDWVEDDRQLARIPGYEMYCAAMLAGVPLKPEGELDAPVVAALSPHKETIKDFVAYFQAVSIKPGPVEEMHRQHMGAYFTHRWRLSAGGLQTSSEWARASKRPNEGKDYEGELDWMRDTQRALIQVVAAVLKEIDRRMSTSSWTNDDRLKQPLAYDLGVQLLTIPTAAAELGGKAGRRFGLLKDGDFQVQAAALASKAPEYLVKWRKWLEDNLQAEVHDTDIEREPLLLLEALSAKALPSEVSNFFLNFVHDSMAGFIGFGMPEFQLNGFGISKFRRIYAGNNGDDFLRDTVVEANKARIAGAKAKRAQRAKWDAEAREYQRANPHPW